MHEQAFIRNREYFNEHNYSFVMKAYGKTLNGLKVKDPLFGKTLKIIFSNGVKASIGSAIQPICPAHYSDDFAIGEENKLSRQGFIDEDGNLKGLSIESLNGKNVVLDDANIAILLMFFLFKIKI